MVLFLEITNIWQKSQAFCFTDFFFLRFLTGMDFPKDFWLFCIYFINVSFDLFKYSLYYMSLQDIL